MIQNLAIAELTLILSLPSVGHFLCSALVEMFTYARLFHSFLTISEGNKGLLGLSLNQFLSLVYSSPRFYAELPRSHKSLLFLRRRSCCVITCERYLHPNQNGMHPGREGGGGLLGLIFAGYVLLASQSPYPIIVYFVANYRPHLSHFWANV